MKVFVFAFYQPYFTIESVLLNILLERIAQATYSYARTIACCYTFGVMPSESRTKKKVPILPPLPYIESSVGPVTGPSSFRTQPRTTDLLPSQHGAAEFPLSQHRRAKLPLSQTGFSLRQRELCRYMLK